MMKWKSKGLFVSGSPRAPFEIMEDGSRKKILPRPVIARLACWKQKEAILKAAREVKPKEIRFFQDLSAKTLQRRTDQIPKLIAERKKDNRACFIVDKLVVHDRKDKSWFQDIVIWLWRHCPMEWSFIPSYFVFIVYVCSLIFPDRF